MITKSADTEIEFAEVLAERWSPRAFDPSAELDDATLLRMLEAARWQASSNNAQPWRFIVARRSQPEFDVISKLLAGFNQQWAPHASALIVALYEGTDVNGKPRPSAPYDLGLAVANLVTQASVDGWHCHQMGGFTKEGMREAFAIDERLQPLVVIAVGKQADASTLDEDLKAREVAPRTRLELQDIVLRGLPS